MRLFSNQNFAMFVAVLVPILLCKPVQAELVINGGISARFGAMKRAGDVPKNYDNSMSAVDGHYALFLSYNQSIDEAYGVGFNCATVATTADGASKGFTASSVPVTHSWDKFFSGVENFAQSRGGFASYGNVNGDTNGPMCNDELNSSIKTPLGKFTAGNIMNPMRGLYDEYTINPVWGNQRSYYLMADIRGNAIQYSETWGRIKFIAHLNTGSDSNVPEAETARDKAYTSVLGYDAGDGTGIGLGFMQTEGDWDAKQVKGSATVGHKALGLGAKTRVGQINLGYTMMGGSMTHRNDVGAEINQQDHTFKVAYQRGAWDFQGFFSKESMEWNTPEALGGRYTVVAPDAFLGRQFSQLKVDRTRFDFWALYDLGKGAKTYVRLDIIQKKFTSVETANWDASMRVTLLEGGWMINF